MTGNILKNIRIILVIGLIYFLFISLFSRTVADVDLWGYLSFGRIFWESGYFPFHDIFSYTPTNPLWVYHEWLTGVVFYPILKQTGPAGLQLFRYIIIVITLYLVYLTALKKGANPISAWIAILPSTFLISFGYSTIVRAQIFTYLFFILTIFILESARKDQKWLPLAWLLPVQLLWCNLHGGFLTGLGLIGLYALGDALSGKKFLPFVIILLPASLVTLINPYGMEYWKFIIHAATMSRPEIDEWMSVISAFKFHYQMIPVASFILLSLVCFLFLITRPKKYFTEILIVTVISYIGYTHVRHTIFLGIIFGAFSPLVICELIRFFSQNKYSKNLSWLSPLLIAGLFLSSQCLIHKSIYVNFLPAFNITASYLYYPIGALKWMDKNNIRGNILPSFGWGEFLIWECYPDCKVAMDGRYETVYPKKVYKEYFDFFMGREGWQVFLNQYPHDLVLIKSNTKINLLLLHQPAWKQVYTDATSSLFMKKTSSAPATNSQ